MHGLNCYCIVSIKIGCPNERPRYFCLARRLGSATASPSSTTLQSHLPWESSSLDYRMPRRTIKEYINELTPDEEKACKVPDAVIAKGSAWCFDIVAADSDRLVHGTARSTLVTSPSLAEETVMLMLLLLYYCFEWTSGHRASPSTIHGISGALDQCSITQPLRAARKWPPRRSPNQNLPPQSSGNSIKNGEKPSSLGL